MNDELDILISRYLDGTASAGEVEQLEVLLGADPRAADELYQASYYDVLLRDSFVTAEGSSADIACPVRLPVAEELTPAASTPSVSTPVQRSTSSIHSRGAGGDGGSYRLPAARWGIWPRVAAVAACLVIGLLVAWRVMRTPGHKPGGEIAVVPTPTEPAIKARLVPTGEGTVIDNPWGARGVAGGGDLVASDEQIRTGYGTATLTFDGESTRVRLASQTTMMLANSGSKRLDLIAGRVDCDVAKQSPDRPLVVLTPQAQITVVGTKFDVSVSRDWTRLHVTEGTVRVMRRTDGATVEVSGGEYVDVPAREARPVTWPLPIPGGDMAEYWSVKVRPAGIKD